MKRLWYLALGLLLCSAPAFAQISTGNIFGVATDEQGAVLPGVNVTLSGDFGTRNTTTGSNGEFRFLQLDNGAYKITVALTGFAKISRAVRVTTAENVNLTFTLKVAAVEETVQVVGETPIVDPKRRGTSTTMTEDELMKTPNARDPWGVLKNVPGVMVDRVNIAGNNNGQQAGFGGHGSVTSDGMFTLDGVTITDMSATGASPAYFDFDAFQEIAVTTGGTDLNVATAGIGINLVTKRGTNAFHGGGRYLYTSDGLESSNLPSSLVTDSRLRLPDGSFRTNADQITKIEDYGGDLGGPIIKDKLWFYGSWGRQQLNLLHLQSNFSPDITKLDSYNGKLNWQATSNTMVSLYTFNGDKIKQGRLTGIGSALGLLEEPSFVWNQANEYTPTRFHGFWKLQVDETFSPNFFMSAKAAYYNTGFHLLAAGGPNQSYTYDYVGGTLNGSYLSATQTRPQKQIDVDGSYFFQGMGGNHELKFGFGYKAVTSSTLTHYNGNGIAGKYNGPGTADGNNFADVHRDGLSVYEGNYTSAYLGDTFTKNRLSVNIGVRYDLQRAKNDAASVPANPGLPNLVPALSVGGATSYGISWSDFSPRVGLSYAFEDSRKTVGRLSYARYAEQLPFGLINNINPVAAGALAYTWNDINGDKVVQPNEVLLDQFQYSYGGVNPSSPGSAVSPNAIDQNFTAAHSNEVVAGLDHELLPNFAVGVAYVWRKNSDIAYYPRLAAACSDPSNPTMATCPIITPNEYVAGKPVTQRGVTVIPFSPTSALVNAGNGGRILTNQPGYSQSFSGLDFTLTKRLSNKWMARVAVTYNHYTQNFTGTPVGGVFVQQGSGAAQAAFQGNPTPTTYNSLVNGDIVSAQSYGSGPATYYTSPTWQVYANGLVQLPWDFELSTAIFTRQGQISPEFINVHAGGDGTLKELATSTIDANRYPNVFDADLRLAKNVKLGGSVVVVLSAEAFNIFNGNTTLQTNNSLSSSTFGRINEILSPRIVRFGARLTF
jgi:hypothetical protein